MASDYAAIRRDNERRYGTDIGRIGPMLLANRYDDRTHFMFELLQNAEDALGRRANWSGSRAVRFLLARNVLRVSHYGKPFDERDVRGICGIAESTKGLTAIGRFGIGFKSVYAFTDRPEIHSGDEDFAIESFVWPTVVPSVTREADETIAVLPLRPEDQPAFGEISSGLQQLGARALLFLREIEEVKWQVKGGSSGIYERRKAKPMGDNARRVTVVAQEEGKPKVEETWLVFSRVARNDEGKTIGFVEIAFSVQREKKLDREVIQAVRESPLVVFFPTVLETHLGFLVQGPYRTTPSRDNVPRGDPWNKHLVQETAALLVEALHSLRDHALLDIGALQCLPLDHSKFSEGAMFAPLFEVTKHALKTKRLLPRSDKTWVAADNALLARSQELRKLFGPLQLAALFGNNGKLFWLSGDITQDRTPELRHYLMHELDIAELTPETIIPKLDKPFLEAQADKWILSLYEFLNGQRALRWQLDDVALIRLEDGTHVVARANGQLQAFLPGAIATYFPTVRENVCTTDAAREFLRWLGLTEPDPVDDVVWNVLPKYRAEEVDVSDADYEADIRRIMTAFGTDSKGQREKLLAALRETAFVMGVDAGDGRGFVSKPSGVYVAAERLKRLFAGVPDVLIVDDTYTCLRGEDVREMLEACGAVRYLRPIEDSSLSWEERSNLRAQAGHAETSGQNDKITDWTLSGLKDLLERLPALETTQRGERAGLLWEELAHLEERRGKGVFSGDYTWTHYGSYRAGFDAAFVRQLNDTAWVPDTNGDLQRPGLVLFDTLGWKPNPFLLSKIRFKPPIIDQLAKEAGIEPGVLDLLKKHGLTSVAELVARLGVSEDPQQADSGSGPVTVGQAIKSLLGGAPGPTPPVPDPTGAEPSGSGSGHGGSGRGIGAGAGSGSGKDAGERSDGQGGERPEGAGTGSAKRTPGGAAGRPFISYVGTHPEEEVADPDGLDQQSRMALEEKAIELILAGEPQLRRTPTHNPGYDLYQSGDDGQPLRWIEVKAMTGSLHDRPVGLSRTQFECAQEHVEAYWLYIVEHAGDDGAGIVRIQDPAGKARTFTFDRGWLTIAEPDATATPATKQAHR
jgi:hypothetical protein